MPSNGEAPGARSARQPWRYQISVRGHLGETMRVAFPALRAETRGADTVLTGELPDTSALYGVIAEIEALGLELIEVRRLRPP
jgi:epsilon-lactone hydrolase